MKDNREPVRKLFAILCSYKIQPEALHFYLLEKVRARFFSAREVLYDHQRVVRDAVFVYSGFLLIYGFDETGDRQLLGIQGSGRILLSKSFTRQSSSDLELVALAGTYLLLLSHSDVLQIFRRFDGTETVARIIMADYAEAEQLRLLLLKERAEKVILSFYREYPEFLKGGLLLDIDIASYLLIGAQTLRNVRMKLIRQGRL